MIKREALQDLTRLAVVLGFCAEVGKVDIGLAAVDQRIGIGAGSFRTLLVCHRDLQAPGRDRPLAR